MVIGDYQIGPNKEPTANLRGRVDRHQRAERLLYRRLCASAAGEGE